MPIVRAGPNEYLLTGRGGRLENRGSAVQAVLLPGAIWVRIPATKQEATFEFTQETKDGIPLRFKGIIVYRITDPLAAARQFDFGSKAGVAQITTLLTHVCLGELRHAVSHMTMVECIEQRKTTLSEVAERTLRETIQGEHDADTSSGGGGWGITVEVAQLAQVYIVDAELRQQLEAEVRNEIRLKSEQSDVRTDEETRLARMASDNRVEEQKLEGDRETMRRAEELELARVARDRRMQVENVETARQVLALEQERFAAEMEAEQARVTTETPVRLLRVAREREVAAEELELRRMQAEVERLDVDRAMIRQRAEQALRLEALPVENAPAIVESAAKVLHGTNLAIYGENAQLVGQLAPLFEILARGVVEATRRPRSGRDGAGARTDGEGGAAAT